MFPLNDHDRDVLAGLSFHAGRALPTTLTDTAHTYGLPIGGLGFPTSVDGATLAAERAADEIAQFGASLRHRAAAAGISMLVRGDHGWPSGTGCDQLPCLWVRGCTDIAGLLRKAVAVTGTRDCTPYGADLAVIMASGLASAGWTVVTNTSHGIDTHAATVAAGAGVLLLAAGGLDHQVTGPVAAAVDQAVATGALISAFPPGCEPIRARFGLRQQLLGELAAAAVLIEADTSSDARQAIRAAARAGRVACAMPGPIGAVMSTGCHQLIAEGTATLVTSASDVIAAISGPHGSAPYKGMYTIRATAYDAAAPTPMVRLPRLHLGAPSHAYAANAVYDLVFGDRPGPVRLFAGVSDSAGVYEAITVAVGD